MEFQLTAWVGDEPGVLERALAALSRQRIRPRRLAAEWDGGRRALSVTVQFEAESEQAAERLAHQVARGVRVHQTAVEGLADSVTREVALVRLRCAEARRGAVLAEASRVGAVVAAAGRDVVLLAVFGDPEGVAASAHGLRAFGIDRVERAVARLALRPAPVHASPLPPLPRHPDYQDNREHREVGT